MPFTFNGIGTALSGYSAPIQWKKPSLFGPKADHDAMECFVVLYLPIIPLRAVHAFNWQGTRYRVLPLRRTFGMILHTYLRPLGLLLTGIGIVMLALGAVGAATEGRQGALAGIAAGAVVGLLGFATLRWLRSRDARTRDVRLVIGPHEAGSSDPALWSKEVLDKLKPAQIADAQAALQAGRYGQAMIGARIAAAQGDPEGERLTDEILAHPNVQSLLPALRREPWRRAELLQA
ncbi:MAG TPA: hypothetical protein VLW85_22570 [Myxococcales bacterium]|nr:hypothetical protein [Myxococcales bacterium]